MSITRIDSGLPVTTKIDSLNSQTLELNGSAQKGQFNKIELDQIFDDGGMLRKFRRNVSLGTTAATYAQWSHYKAENGYSIWTLAPSGYQYSADNALYFDNRVVVNQGLATSLAASAFDKVFYYNGSTYTDNTSEASSESGTAFVIHGSTSHFLYIGATATFAGIQFRLNRKGNNYTRKVEYYNGSAWTQLTAVNDALVDNTANFVSDGTVEFTAPTNWATTSVNSSTLYWVRFSTTTNPTVVATAYQIVPENSVVSLLALSSDELITETWKWCSFNSSIYVTIRNAGSASTEGTFYITSSSSASNKQAFFASNHAFTADYQDAAYVIGGAAAKKRMAAFENISSGDLLYIGSSDGKVRRANASTASTMPVRYMAATNITSGGNGAVVQRGELTLTTWSWVPGAVLFVGSGAGVMSHVAPVFSGSQQQRVGYAQSSTSVYFDPDLSPTRLKQFFMSPDAAVVGSGASVSRAVITTVDDSNSSKRIITYAQGRDDAADWVINVPSDFSSGANLKLYARSPATSGQVMWQARVARVTPPAASDPTLTTYTTWPSLVPGSANQTFMIDINVPAALTANDQCNIRVVRAGKSSASDTVANDVNLLYALLEYA